MKRLVNLILSLFVMAGFVFTTVPSVKAEETSPDKVVEKKGNGEQNKTHKKKKKHANQPKKPAGWTKGEKKGWDGGTTPPGLSGEASNNSGHGPK